MFHRITILGRVTTNPKSAPEGAVFDVGTMDDFVFKVYATANALQFKTGDQLFIEGRLRRNGLDVLADKIYGAGAVTKPTRQKFGIEDGDF